MESPLYILVSSCEARLVCSFACMALVDVDAAVWCAVTRVDWGLCIQ